MAAQFTEVSITRPYTLVARQIESQIRNGNLVRGEKLPTEREMMGSFGVSRGVVREAVKVLDTMGLVESRQGSGIFVRNDPIPAVSRALTLSVTPDEESIQRLFEFREPLEALAARFAAERRTAPQLERIEQALADNLEAAERGDAAATHRADQRFHAAIGAASGNPYLAAVLGAVWQMKDDLEPMIFAKSKKLGGAYHRRIAQAIAAQDSDAAAAVMAEHVRMTGDGWRRELITDQKDV